MKKFDSLTSDVLALPMVNIDTDIIMPSDFLKVIKWAGLGAHAFHGIRYNADGSLKPPFDDPKAKDAQIIIAGDNFGCGSSREHAPVGIADMGVRCIIAPSFADIFSQNAFKSGILLIALPQDACDRLLEESKDGPLMVDLEHQTMATVKQTRFTFEVDAFRKHCLLHGLDQIGLTLQHEDAIAAYEAKQKEQFPWLGRP